MRNEKAFSKTLREKCAKYGTSFWTFENCGYKDVPDLYSISAGFGICWIELKIIPTVESRIPFRSGQQQWLRNHAEKGGNGCVMTYVQKTNAVYLFIIRPRSLIVNGLFNGNLDQIFQLTPDADRKMTIDLWEDVACWFYLIN